MDLVEKEEKEEKMDRAIIDNSHDNSTLTEQIEICEPSKKKKKHKKGNCENISIPTSTIIMYKRKLHKFFPEACQEECYHSMHGSRSNDQNSCLKSCFSCIYEQGLENIDCRRRRCDMSGKSLEWVQKRRDRMVRHVCQSDEDF